MKLFLLVIQTLSGPLASRSDSGNLSSRERSTTGYRTTWVKVEELR